MKKRLRKVNMLLTCVLMAFATTYVHSASSPLLNMHFSIEKNGISGDSKMDVLGKSYAEWTVDWWKWIESRNYMPFTESGSIDCAAGQKGSVWFLAGTEGTGPVVRTCTIPKGKALFYPLVNAEWSNAASESLTVAEKRAFLDAYMSGNDLSIIPSRACNMQSIVDGVPTIYSGVPIVRAQSAPFPYNQFGDNYDAQSVSDGYWTMLLLPKGQHTLQIKGAICGVPDNSTWFEVDVTYNINIK